MERDPNTTVAMQLATMVERVVYDELDEDTLLAAKARALDALGIMISALSTPAFAVVKRYLASLGRVSAIVGERAGVLEDVFPPRGVNLDSESYGFITGAPAFIENYGDTSLYSVAHPNTVVVPAALVAARTQTITGKEFIEGLVAGYQVMEYLGQTLNNGSPRMAHQVRGFRPTATCGPAGAAAVIAKLWSVAANDVATCLSVACNLAAGLRRTDASDVTHMRIHSGEVVRSGVEAVMLVEAGLGVDDQLIEGAGGFFHAMANGELDQQASKLLEPASPWAINEVAFKVHATPHTLAPGLDCLIELARARPNLYQEIRSVRIEMPNAHADISLGAALMNPADLSAISALDHFPFCAAIALITGDVIYPDVPALFIGDPNVLELANRIEIVADADQTKIFESVAGSWPVRVVVVADRETIILDRQTPFGTELDTAVGDELKRKFQIITKNVLNAERQSAVVALIDSIDKSDDVFRDLLFALELETDSR